MENASDKLRTISILLIRICQIALIAFSLYSVQKFFSTMSNSLDFAINRPASQSEQRNTLLAELPRMFISTDPNQVIETALNEEDFALAGLYINYAQNMPYRPGGRVEIRSDLLQRYEESQTFLAKAGRLGSQCAEGVVFRTADTATQFGCQAGSNLFLVGDLADLAKEGYSWANNENVDEVIVGLSLVGLGASTVPLLYPAAGGAGIGKVIIKGGAKTFPVAKPLRVAVRNAVDFPALKTELGTYTSWRRLRRGLRDFNYQKYLRPDDTKVLVDGLSHLSTLSSSLSPAVTIRTLKRVDDFGELSGVVKVTNVVGKDATTVVGIMGKAAPRVLRAARPAVAYAKFTYKSSLALWGLAAAALIALLEFGLRRWLWALTVIKCKGNGVSVIPKFWEGEGVKFLGVAIVAVVILAAGHWQLNQEWNATKEAHRERTIANQQMQLNAIYLNEIHRMIDEGQAPAEWYRRNSMGAICDAKGLGVRPSKILDGNPAPFDVRLALNTNNIVIRAARCTKLVDDFLKQWPLET